MSEESSTLQIIYTWDFSTQLIEVSPSKIGGGGGGEGAETVIRLIPFEVHVSNSAKDNLVMSATGSEMT